MPLYPPVLKKYTAPTCSLEILAQSPLSEREWRRSSVTPHSFQLQIHYLESGTSAVAASNEPTQISIALRGTIRQLQTLHQTIQEYLYKFLGNTDLTPYLEESDTLSLAAHEIALIPKTLTQHILRFGELASDLPVSEVEIASTQLLDLSSTLDSYASEAARVVRQRHYRSSLWSKASQVAAVGIVAIGLTGLVASLLSSHKDGLILQVANKDTPKREIALQNPTIQSPTQLPALPFGPALPIGLTAAQSAAGKASKPTPNPTAGKLTVPAIPIPTPSQLPTPNASASTTAVASISTPTALFTPSTAREIPFTPQPTEPKTRSGAPLSDVLARRLPEVRSTAPLTPNVSPLIPSAVPLPDAPPKVTAPAVSADALQSGFNAANPASRSQPLQTLTPLGKQTPADSKLATGSTAFDTIQQISEVRQYFKDRWQPPTNADQVLEYRLMLNSDGSLWQIVPLGEAAGRNLDRTGMPAVGAAFVSPIPRNQKAKIRLVLFPDGKVQTFLEGLTP